METPAAAWARLLAGADVDVDDTTRAIVLGRCRAALSSEDVSEREQAAIIAARIGGFRGFSVCRSFLRDPSPLVRMRAVVEAAAGGAEGLATVRDGAADADPEVATAAFLVLTERRDPGATSQARRALSHADGAVRVAAIGLLAVVGGPAVGPLIEAKRSDPDPRVVEAATAALGSRATAPAPRSTPAPVPPPEVAGLLRSVGSADTTVDLLASLMAARSTALLAAGRASPDPVERLGFVRAAVLLGRRDWANAVRACLGDEDVAVRAEAAAAVGDLAGLSAVPALIEALEDPYPSVRSAAARSLGKLGGPAARAALAEARAEERDPTVASVIDHARASAP